MLRRITTFVLLTLLCCVLGVAKASKKSKPSVTPNPVYGLLERIDPGASEKFVVEITPSEDDFFELDQAGDKVLIRANNYISAATGLNWYLKHYAGIHLSWNNMKAQIPDALPKVEIPERHDASTPLRYMFNYCTFSYSMPFWDWERWEQELDWMALHGVNLPLSIVGMEGAWRNMLLKLGYNEDEIAEFIAGPAFLAWWHMNNIQGWGGPNPESWYEQQTALQQQIITRMNQWGIKPVFPGYSGMLPSNADEKLGVNISKQGLWSNFERPAFMQPTDPNFQKIADLYYQEVENLFGKADYYSMDPFHEGGQTEGVDLGLAGKELMKAMKKHNPNAVWVIQGWQKNPRDEMISVLDPGDMLVLDLSAECRPMWGDPDSYWYRENGFGHHDWIYCMLLNFGGCVGMHGRMDNLINGYYRALSHPKGQHIKGVGMTPEGIENNPIMFELICELPWRSDKFSKEDWTKEYVKARYGRDDLNTQLPWQTFAKVIYNSPFVQEGATESVFCSRPKLYVKSSSSWHSALMYYQPEEILAAAKMMVDVADQYRGNNNFEYDLVDIVRQTIADKGNALLPQIAKAYNEKDKAQFDKLSNEFLHLIKQQDRLLNSRKDFMVGNWLEKADKVSKTEADSIRNQFNARTIITTWGDRLQADDGELRDYSHREWAGLLNDLYYKRWKLYFENLSDNLDGKPLKDIDWFAIEQEWTTSRNPYPSTAQSDPIDTAVEIFYQVHPLSK